jgi:hypothetical protein
MQILFILLLLLVYSSLVYAKRYLFCSNEYKVEPDVNDIIYSLTGANISTITGTRIPDGYVYESVTELAVDSMKSFSFPYLNSILSIEIPLMKVRPLI